MKYHCPKCSGALNMSGGIVLVGEFEDRRTVFVFDPEPGKYQLEVADGEEITPGTIWEFICPLCGENLSSEFNKRLARLHLASGDGMKQVVFSKVASERATFVLGEEMEIHGDHARDYID